LRAWWQECWSLERWDWVTTALLVFHGHSDCVLKLNLVVRFGWKLTVDDLKLSA
jgi:hypothetical protein